MLRVTHVLDSSFSWEQRQALTQLLERLPADRHEQTLASIDPVPAATLQSIGRRITLCPRRLRFELLAAPHLRRLLDERPADVIHTWGPHAAAAARAATDKPVLVELFDPLVAMGNAKLLRTLADRGRFAAVCSAEIIRRRLIENGITPGDTATIRPGVDFALINAIRRSDLRARLGLNKDDYVVIVPPGATRDRGDFDAVWAAALLSHLQKNVRVILPGVARESVRIARLIRSTPHAATIRTPGDAYPFEQLLAVCDALVVPARGDIATTAIAWAMAAGVVVIGSAVHSVAEMLASKHNGLLFKQTPGRNMTISIAKCLMDRETQLKVKETARAQAYEIFGIRRYVDQHARAYDNLVSGRPVSEGVTDSARSA